MAIQDVGRAHKMIKDNIGKMHSCSYVASFSTTHQMETLMAMFYAWGIRPTPAEPFIVLDEVRAATIVP